MRRRMIVNIFFKIISVRLKRIREMIVMHCSAIKAGINIYPAGQYKAVTSRNVGDIIFFERKYYQLYSFQLFGRKPSNIILKVSCGKTDANLLFHPALVYSALWYKLLKSSLLTGFGLLGWAKSAKARSANGSTCSSFTPISFRW